jgi:hypothetical protein
MPNQRLIWLYRRASGVSGIEFGPGKLTDAPFATPSRSFPLQPPLAALDPLAPVEIYSDEMHFAL